MSSRNVETVRRLYQAFNRGALDSMLEVANADIEFDASERLPDEGVIRGRDAYRRFFERTFDTWERFVVEIDELLDAGDAVVALVRISGVGKSSQVTVEASTPTWYGCATAGPTASRSSRIATTPCAPSGSRPRPR